MRWRKRNKNSCFSKGRSFLMKFLQPSPNLVMAIARRLRTLCFVLCYQFYSNFLMQRSWSSIIQSLRSPGKVLENHSPKGLCWKNHRAQPERCVMKIHIKLLISLHVFLISALTASCLIVFSYYAESYMLIMQCSEILLGILVLIL